MSFLSSAFLFGLAAAAIPLLIHLIQRQRYPERHFTTLRFFDKTIKNNTIQRRIIDKILLLLRIAALCAIAFGLARPFSKSGPGERRSSFVIVLDNSPSMSRERDGKTLFELGKRVADDVLADLAPTDRAELLFTAPLAMPRFGDRNEIAGQLALREGKPTAVLVSNAKNSEFALTELSSDSARVRTALKDAPAGAQAALYDFELSQAPQFSSNSERLRQLLQQAKISAQPGNVKSALAAAARLLHTSQDGDRKIILISDMQKSEWVGEKPGDLAGLSVLAVPLDAPAAPGTNLGIEACTLPASEADFGQIIVGTAKIRNYGTQNSDASTLTVTSGDRGKPSEIKLPAISAGSTMLVNFPIQVMSGERNLLCHAHINMPADPFAYDDNWYFQLGVRFPVTTLLINGTPTESVSSRATFFLANALAPRSGSGQNNAADVRECELADLKDRRFAEYGVLVLAGVPALDADAREKIRQFVSDGKGVLIFPGNSSTPEEYNAWGFLPAQITERKTQSFAYVKSIDEKAPAMAGIQDRLGSSIHSLSTGNRFILKPSEQAAVLARFSDGSPALVEGTVGKGRIIIAATGAHAADSDWPLRPAFVILVRNLIKYLGRDPAGAALLPDRTVGESTSTIIPRDLSAGTPAAFHMKGVADFEPLPWIRSVRSLIQPAASSEGHLLMTVQPGVEAGVVRAPKVGCSLFPVSINHSLRESVLAPLTAEELPEYLSQSLDVVIRPYTGESMSVVADLRTGRDLWRWILIAAVAILALESIVAWRSQSEAVS